MILDPHQLQAEAEAHQKRLKSPLWDDEKSIHHEGETITVGDAQTALEAETLLDKRPTQRKGQRNTSQEQDEPTPKIPSITDHDLKLYLNEFSNALQALQQTVAQLQTDRYSSSEVYPSWLREAAGNPLTYDAPNPSRKSFCVRVLPDTYSQLQRAQKRLGLRTIAGAWECLLRLGLAAAERLPT